MQAELDKQLQILIMNTWKVLHDRFIEENIEDDKEGQVNFSYFNDDFN